MGILQNLSWNMGKVQERGDLGGPGVPTSEFLVKMQLTLQMTAVFLWNLDQNVTNAQVTTWLWNSSRILIRILVGNAAITHQMTAEFL